MPPCYTFAQKTMNRPLNVLLKLADPREEVVCEFEQHSVPCKLRIHQTPADASWPGGALWDCGVLIAELMLAVSGVQDMTLKCTLDVEGLPLDGQTTNPTPTAEEALILTTRTTTQLSSRFQTWLAKTGNRAIWRGKVEPVLLHRPNLTILELGCGVGLTGLVAAVALGAKTCIMTDLTVVVDDVTRHTVRKNTTADHSTIKHSKGEAKVVAMPLCWGNQEEGAQVLKSLRELTPNATHPLYPDIILLGDVAYQHRPKEPLPFDILVETLQQVMPPDEAGCEVPPTLLIFGIRLRQPVSIELLELFQKHFTPVLPEPIPAQVLDPEVEGFQHQMTIHIFTNKRS